MLVVEVRFRRRGKASLDGLGRRRDDKVESEDGFRTREVLLEEASLAEYGANSSIVSVVTVQVR